MKGTFIVLFLLIFVDNLKQCRPRTGINYSN
jgi:hypothetical protein